MIKGSNLLNQALTVIPKQSFGYLKFLSKTTNDIGIDVPTYAPEVTLFGSVQAVPRTLFQSLGLDWKKNYIMIYSSDELTGIERDSSGDRVVFGGKTYQALYENDWRQIYGWAGVLCVEVNP